MNNQTYYELYRRSSIGVALTDALDDLISDGRIAPQLAMKILSNFDRSVTDILAQQVTAKLSFKVQPCSPVAPQALLMSTDNHQGHLDTYRFCDEVWTFLIKDVTFKLDNSQTIQSERVKIVSCNSKKPGET
ncbi:Transcription initiation factor IIA small chain (TFIIA 13.5 kDa subunit) [Orbilia oligospora]|uniref:Transcription initiation factor IIA subunit 2 n=1 Tax=Orbilia oligospora TaxID=2813651 RepID=A0A7C8PEZ8_ORBOL|nr:Transcription initiation factor IIA small chain (TFIIA 13.5 kDa subunit) [Orbilia oligospora]KAF3167316.1 Transcription initiation factor IIA small chain (TFIIA 13.5 kDa subunit) [Orbilia oligospora]KAF3240011.1 Transcription initiation factor IIA small chain (TFIIA 13.5 kDa subunit) [Orbilia oligospora]KAF3269390.1 Transcription initiation factor IIA small chain (TFIIA 13.5 kDa subunit) [Orbilia oligospora]KAF3277202.1 Transcription initiation factor IIA small chain (TFIIA 13.5 kDa subunit)